MSETSASKPGPDVPEPPNPPEPPKPAKPVARPTAFDASKQARITDPQAMKALAHPARMAVFDYLAVRRLQGYDGATATEIAEVAGVTPSAMSYHLRTLAKAGFIEEAPSRGDGRERLWRLGLHSFSIQAEEGAPESTHVVERAMTKTFADRQDEDFRRWIDVRDQADPEVREASDMSQSRLRLTPAEAREFQDRFHELTSEYMERTLERVDRADDDDGSLVFSFQFRLFPSS